MRTLRSSLIIAFMICLPTTILADDSRVALVIGNSNYQQYSTVTAPRHNAQLIAVELKRLGFAVTKLVDLQKEELEYEIRRFYRLLEPGSTSFLYFSGHGSQIDGVPHIVPVDAEKTGSKQDADQLVAFPAIQKAVVESRCQQNVIVFEACRNVPKFNQASSYRKMPSLPEVKRCTVAFSTSSQKVAIANDGEKACSPFTSELLNAIRQSEGNVYANDVLKTAANQLSKRALYVAGYGRVAQHARCVFDPAIDDFSLWQWHVRRRKGKTWYHADEASTFQPPINVSFRVDKVDEDGFLTVRKAKSPQNARFYVVPPDTYEKAH